MNKVFLMGRLGKDPEVRYTKAGDAVASFSLATDESYKDKNGTRQQKTQWHNVVAWRKLADFSQQYLGKGRLILVEGRLNNRTWNDKDNVKHYATDVVAEQIRFAGPKPDAAKDGTAQPDGHPETEAVPDDAIPF